MMKVNGKTKKQSRAPLSIIPELQQLQAQGKPITVAINGKKKFQVQDAKTLQKLLDFVDWVETLEAVREGLEEMKAGKGISLEEFKEEVRQKYGISC